jgi:hypothetical protein
MVLGDVPKSERCRCRETPRQAKSPTSAGTGSKTGVTASAPDTAVGRFKAWLRQ